MRGLGITILGLLVLPAQALLPTQALAQPASADTSGDTPGLIGQWNAGLEGHGIELGGDEILETLGNPIGGVKQGAVVEGRLELFTNVDLDKAFGWSGAIFHANAYQIHGRGLSADFLKNLLTVSNIETPDATRLFSLWFQQSLADDAVSLRAGQIAADDEFFVSQYASLFINSTFGWPAILGVNLPSGGPAYDAARPGIRARVALSPQWSLSAALFSGDPRVAPSGFDFHLNGNLFAISEVAYAGALLPDLPSTIKLGSWIHTGLFADQHYDPAHISLASAASSGVPARHRGDYGGYFIIDQLLWRKDSTSDSGLGLFLRAGGDPGDRNLIELHMDGGLSYSAPFGRDNDSIGLGLSYEQVSSARDDLTLDYRQRTGTLPPLPDFESAVELTYQAQAASWWIIQPDLQWIIHPGGRVLNLSAPQSPMRAGALVLGLRMAVSF